jgi:polygalacturonase
MNVTNVLLQKINITADKPFGIYYAQNVRLVNSKITTPDGVNKIYYTNAQITIVAQ